MQCTHDPATIGNQGRERQGVPWSSGAVVPAQSETVEVESPTVAWNIANLTKDHGELLKIYIPIDGPKAQDKFTRCFSPNSLLEVDFHLD